MLESELIDLFQKALVVTVKISAPILIFSVLVGLLVSILQTTTAIQEQTLTFLPKLVAIGFALLFFFSYMIRTIMDYTTELYMYIVKF